MHSSIMHVWKLLILHPSPLNQIVPGVALLLLLLTLLLVTLSNFSYLHSATQSFRFQLALFFPQHFDIYIRPAIHHWYNTPTALSLIYCLWIEISQKL